MARHDLFRRSSLREFAHCFVLPANVAQHSWRAFGRRSGSVYFSDGEAETYCYPKPYADSLVSGPHDQPHDLHRSSLPTSFCPQFKHSTSSGGEIVSVLAGLAAHISNTATNRINSHQPISIPGPPPNCHIALPTIATGTIEPPKRYQTVIFCVAAAIDCPHAAGRVCFQYSIRPAAHFRGEISGGG